MPAASISDAAESYSASQTYASGLTGREQAAEQLVSQDQVPAENQSNSQTGGQTAAQPMTSSSGSENNVYSASALSSEQLIGESSAPEAAPAAKAIKAEAGKENTIYNSEKTRTADNKNTPAADTPSAQRQNTENVQDTVNLQAKNGIKLSPEAMQQQGKVVIEQVAENYTPAKTTSAPTDMNSEVPFSGTVIETFSSAGDIGKTSVSAFAEDNKIKVGVMTGETLKNAGIKESGIKESGFKESVISSEAGISDSSSMAAEKNALSENITSTEQAVSRQTVSSAFVSPAPSAARDTAVDKTVDMLKTGSLLHITGNNGKELNVSIKDNADGSKAEGSNLAGYGEVSEKDVELLSGLDKFQGRNGLKISAALEARPETKPAADAAEPAVKEIQMQAAQSEGADKQAFTAQGEPANKEAALKETDNKELFEKESFTGETKSKAAETENAGLREERKTGPSAGEHAAQRDNASQSERMLRNDAMQSGGFKNLSGRIKEFQDNAVKMKSGEVKQVHETSQKPKPAESAGPVKEEAAAQDIKPANQPAKETSPGEGEEQAGRQQQSSQSEQQHRKTSDGFVIANADNTIKTQDLQVKAKPEVPGSSVMKHVKDVEVIKEISRFIQQSEKGSLVLRVDPEHLGSIKIALETIDNMMHAKIEVENEAARKLVENNLNHLQSSLNQNGVQLSSLNVSLAEYSQKGQAQQERPGQRKRGQSFSDSMQNEEANPAGEKDLGYNTYEYLA